MITDSIYFTQKSYDIIEEIENDMDNAIITEKFLFSRFTRNEIHEIYCNIFYEFPYRIIPKNNFIGVSVIASEILEGGLSFDEYKEKNKLFDYEIDDLLKNRKEFKPQESLETIDFFIDTYFNHLFYRFDIFLDRARKFPFFNGIDNEEIILLNLLNHYKSTLLNENIQIDFFWAIQLPKEINDKILLLLIEYLEQRLLIINIKSSGLNFENKNSVIPVFQSKLIWNGTQQQLCELFLKLEEYNWIEKIDEGKLKLFVSSLCNLFDIKKTKKKETSDEKNSLYQIFKGEIIDGVKTYPFLEKSRYKKVIESINNN